MKTKDLVLIAILTALMAILAPISIPLTLGVPISLGTFMVMLIGVILKQSNAVVTVSLYIVLAFIGLPVLSGYTSGASILFGMTGGYIFGYIPLAFITGLATSYSLNYENKRIRDFVRFLGMIIGTIILYAMGTWWFMKYTGLNLSSSLSACVIPFIPLDLFKMIIVTLISPRIETIAKR